jgi:hypothetical protein
VFGVDPIKLITNVTGATISIKSGTNGTEGQEFVSLDADGKLLTILKPGTVTLKITVTERRENIRTDPENPQTHNLSDWRFEGLR